MPIVERVWLTVATGLRNSVRQLMAILNCELTFGRSIDATSESSEYMEFLVPKKRQCEEDSLLLSLVTRAKLPPKPIAEYTPCNV